MNSKILLFAIVALLVGSTARAYDFSAGGIYYNITDATAKTVEVTSGDADYTGAVAIPAQVTNGGNTYSVTSIGDYAFFRCYSLTSVIIPSSVTSIGKYAISYCTGLTSVAIPSSVTSLGDGAFYLCSGLTSVTIPSSVTSIGVNAFSFCSRLTSVAIPSSVTSIGSAAFYYCLSLTSVTISSSVTSIGNGAFASCSALADVYCLAQTPPTCGTDPFNALPATATLHVPAGTRAAYQAAAGWSSFATITDDATSGLRPSATGKRDVRIAGGTLLVAGGGNPLVKVYSLSGQLLLQDRGSSVALGSIAQGVYIVDVDGARSKVVK